MKQKKVAIIGAGLTALTTAYHLNKAGIEVKLFEKSDRTGGVIKTIKKDGFLFETGPNSGIISNIEIVELFDELKSKIEIQKADKMSAKRLIWKKDKWHALPGGLWSAINTPLFSLGDKFRILGEPFRAKGNNPNENLADMVKRRLGKSYLNYAVDPFILGIYAGDPSYLIPKYALPKLYALEQDYGSFIRGAIKKKKLPKTDLEKRVTREIFSIKGGMEELPKSLVSEIGEEHIYLNQNNFKVEKKGDVYILNNESFDYVISTAPANALESLFGFIEKSELKDISNLKYAKVAGLSYGFKEWKGMDIMAFGGLIPFKEKRDILGALFMSSMFKNRCRENGAVITIFVGGTRNEAILQQPREDLVKQVNKEVQEVLKIKGFNPDSIELTIYERAIAQYGIDSKARLQAIKRIENQHKNLFLAGSIRDGIGIADRIKQAKDISQNIILDA